LTFLFIIFIFMTAFFICNVMITILITTYQWNASKKYDVDKLNDEEKRWATVQNLLLEVTLSPKPIRSTNYFRGIFFDISRAQSFENFIAFCVGLNILVLCSEFYNSPKWYKDTLEYANTVFVVIFMVEAVIKLIGLGPKMYFAFQ